jgi:integrase
MARSVYKICKCRTQVKCRHPWWFSVKHRGGPQLRKSLDVVLETHIDSKTIAEHEAERLRIGILDDTLPSRTRELLGLPVSTTPMRQALTLAHLLNGYVARQGSRSASTIDRQRYQIGIALRTELPRLIGGVAPLADWLVEDVTADTLEQLREIRTVRGVHASGKSSNLIGGRVAANRSLRLLRAAFNWGLRTGAVTQGSPFKRAGVNAVTLSKETARSRRFQTGEAERLLAACGPHLRAVVEAALETGCRRGELLNLRWSQVQLAPRPELWLAADQTKTAKARRVPISTRLQAILAMRRHDPDGHPFPADAFVLGNEIGGRVASVKTAWQAACRRANITDLHFHDLRREAGSRWMEAGVPLATIQKWLGHANISQTSVYLSTTTAGEHEAMRRFEERIGRLIPIDTAGVTPPQSASLNHKESLDSIQQNTIKH